MGIRLKLAESGKELNDVFWVRRQVFSVEEGKFGGDRLAENLLVDHFDAHPRCANLIAYDGDEPIATIRVNLDTGSGLPPEGLYDFSPERERIAHTWLAQNSEEPVFLSAGMLAVRRDWRRRRDVVRALIKLATTIGKAWGGTHVIVTANHENETMYRRIGFTAVEDRFWVEEIGNHVLPMASTLSDIFARTVGSRLDDLALLNCFSSQFQRIVYRAGESVFRQFDDADECYVIDIGSVKITTNTAEDSRELVLADLGPGELFGEMALINAKTRSANATAVSDTELIVLRRDDFMEGIQQHPEREGIVLGFISDRLRRTDEFVKLLAFGSTKQRIEFALNSLLESGRLKAGTNGTSLLRVGPAELAEAAATDTPEVIAFLDELSEHGTCQYNESRIEFLQPYCHSQQTVEIESENVAAPEPKLQDLKAVSSFSTAQ